MRITFETGFDINTEGRVLFVSNRWVEFSCSAVPLIGAGVRSFSETGTNG